MIYSLWEILQQYSPVLLNFHHRRTGQLDIQVPYDSSYSDPIDHSVLDCRYAASKQEA